MEPTTRSLKRKGVEPVVLIAGLMCLALIFLLLGIFRTYDEPAVPQAPSTSPGVTAPATASS